MEGIAVLEVCGDWGMLALRFLDQFGEGSRTLENLANLLESEKATERSRLSVRA